MSTEALWERVQMAWSMLSKRPRHRVEGSLPRVERPPLRGDEPASSREGFVEEAIPWLDAVYLFATRLTEGDQDAAEDLVQETFLRAHRFWDRYERGTNVKSWLFTICRNTHLHTRGLARNRHKRTASDLDPRVEALATASAFAEASPDPERIFFDGWIDDEVVRAIDALPEDQESELRRHFEVCGRCYPQYDFQRAYLAYTRRLADREQAPPELRQRLFQRILEQERGSGNGR